LHIVGGRVRLPAIDDIAALIDWDRVERHAFRP
jgi:hypothetical protein